MPDQGMGRMSMGPLAIVVFDIDGVVRDVGGSYRRALADTVEHYTEGYRPTMADIDQLKAEGLWNNDWEASRELVYRYFEKQGVDRNQLDLDYQQLVAFFQSRYRGSDPNYWTGYICQEPLLMRSDYLDQLTAAAIPWGFFSGATRGSACYVLEKRLGLLAPVLVAMEDAPGKPDPTGLLQAVWQIEQRVERIAAIAPPPVLYAGDTVADMQTIQNVKAQAPQRHWIGIGILPPHAQGSADYATSYREQLQAAGAAIVLDHIEQLTPAQIAAVCDEFSVTS